MMHVLEDSKREKEIIKFHKASVHIRCVLLQNKCS